MRYLITLLALVIASCASAPDPAAQTIVLTGAITHADHQTYREIPFTVPEGTTRIAVDFTYDKDNRTVIDLGLRDPQGQRGWSGGNKTNFEIGAFDATPSYKPGPIQPGEWKLVLGIPNIREGQTASYAATITFSGKRDKDRRFVRVTTHGAPSPAGWYRGDFHTHTAHSDGSCDVEGVRAPCPAERTFDAARDAGLHFVAITDHNTITQREDITSLQGGYLSPFLLIPGTEVTTFNGHANVIGNTDFVDFQLGSERLPTLDALFDQVDAAGGFLSINHPSLPSGEVCMGCGWTVKDTDWSRVTAIEVINGSTLRTAGAEAPMSGIRLWEDLLREGHRITAIGGSDNHDATDTTGARQSPIGRPATVVHAETLSTSGIVAGVKSGRVFIDVAGLPNATLDTVARLGDTRVFMGGELTLTPHAAGVLDVLAENLPDGARAEPVAHNVTAAPFATPEGLAPGPPWSFQIALAQGARAGWVRINIRDASGKLLLLGNPIYVTAAPAG